MDKQPSLAVDAALVVAMDAGAERVHHIAVTPAVIAGLLDAAPDGLLLVDALGQIALVNNRIDEMFGYDRCELVGQTVEMLLPHAFREVHVAHRQRYLDRPRTRAMGAGLSLSGRHKDGSEVPVEISLSPLVAAGAQWTVAAVRDVTERLAIEHRRRDSAVTAEQSRIAEDLADTVIHGLFGTGLQLQGLLEEANGRVRPGLEAAIENIDRTIRGIRTAVFGLRPGETERDAGEE